MNTKLVMDGVAAMRAFRAALDDDLNTAEALAAIFEFVREANIALDQGGFLSLNRGSALVVLEEFDSFFDVLKPSTRGTKRRAHRCRDRKADRRAHRREESA